MHGHYVDCEHHALKLKATCHAQGVSVR